MKKTIEELRSHLAKSNCCGDYESDFVDLLRLNLRIKLAPISTSLFVSTYCIYFYEELR